MVLKKKKQPHIPLHPAAAGRQAVRHRSGHQPGIWANSDREREMQNHLTSSQVNFWIALFLRDECSEQPLRYKKRRQREINKIEYKIWRNPARRWRRIATMLWRIKLRQQWVTKETIMLIICKCQSYKKLWSKAQVRRWLVVKRWVYIYINVKITVFWVMKLCKRTIIFILTAVRT